MAVSCWCVHYLAVHMYVHVHAHTQSEYQGHIQMLMNYIDPNTEGIVIAGGDGTVLEVLNGLLQRRDAVSTLPFDLANLVHVVWCTGDSQEGCGGDLAFRQGEPIIQDFVSISMLVIHSKVSPPPLTIA